MSAPLQVPPRWIGWTCLAILGLGCLQFAGYLLGNDLLRGVGAACGFAPYTKVFSDVEGFETFAADFVLHLERADGSESVVAVTPEFYRQLRGPYNRRNVYGAALSYAPRLPEELWSGVFCHGLGPGGPLREEFGIGPEVRQISIGISTRTAGRSDQWMFRPVCSD